MSAKYEFIDAQKAQYAIVKMCRWLGVSTSGFYEWRDRPASATARRRERLAALIQWIYDDSAPGRLVEGATVQGWKAALGALALAYPDRLAGYLT